MLWLAKMTTPNGVTMQGSRGPMLGMVNVFEFPMLRTFGVTMDSWHKPSAKGRIQRDTARVRLVPHLEGCLLSIKDMLKQPVGDTVDKIVSGYQFLYCSQMDEDVIFSKFRNAISCKNIFNIVTFNIILACHRIMSTRPHYCDGHCSWRLRWRDKGMLSIAPFNGDNTGLFELGVLESVSIRATLISEIA
ncbi:hypothetical protein Goshw_022271 [Gossypium schwendimanii]|uniref:Uncharacterized protein n=1 Tax=Gossypium schwendimanii TaxID=34291 RepID=A0A7J9MDV0_GOSSC|nr:hypothetical protein [Gossypium schwendimanii]